MKRDVTEQQQAGARQNHSDSQESGSEDIKYIVFSQLNPSISVIQF